MEVNVFSRSQPAAAAVAAAGALAGEPSSDVRLINRIAVGDKRAMQTLFARHRTFVYRWLLGFVSNDETLAEDLLNEVFFDFWRQGTLCTAVASRPGTGRGN